MLNDFPTWLFNVMVWGAIFVLVALLIETYVSRGFLSNGLNAIIGLGVIAGLSLFWPKY